MHFFLTSHTPQIYYHPKQTFPRLNGRPKLRSPASRVALVLRYALHFRGKVIRCLSTASRSGDILHPSEWYAAYRCSAKKPTLRQLEHLEAAAKEPLRRRSVTWSPSSRKNSPSRLVLICNKQDFRFGSVSVLLTKSCFKHGPGSVFDKKDTALCVCEESACSYCRIKIGN